MIPTDEAFNEYLANGYSSKGSDYTDASDNGYLAVTGGASSEKEGFYSNTEATISYKWKDKDYTEKYPEPVVQVDPIVVKKTWSGIKNPTNVVLVQLVDKNRNPVPGKILKLSSQNNYTGKFAVEQASNYSGVRELKKVSKDTANAIQFEGSSYTMVDNNGTLSIGDSSYKVTYANGNNSTYTITNTKSSQKIKILKKRSGSGSSDIYLKGAEFTLVNSKGNIIKIGTNTNGTYISDENGLVLEGDIDYGTYTLKEVKAPSGYMLLESPVTINVDENGITVANSPVGKVTCEKTDNNIYTISVTNAMLYSLPSTGGTGIYLYMIGGMFLMFAAVWILYKNKCKEVLGK